MKSDKKSLPFQDQLLSTLKTRFEKNMNRHKGLDWNLVLSKLEKNPHQLHALNEMEKSGGEPDVVRFEKKIGEIVFFDCSLETPKDRRSLCYDKAALDGRKENKPKGSAIEAAKKMGIELLDEEEYLELQRLGNFDTKTSSWLKTPIEVRKLGGAIFGDFRYNRVFFYHNGAESYYAVRGFRGSLKIS